MQQDAENRERTRPQDYGGPPFRAYTLGRETPLRDARSCATFRYGTRFTRSPWLPRSPFFFPVGCAPVPADLGSGRPSTPTGHPRSSSSARLDRRLARPVIHIGLHCCIHLSLIQKGALESASTGREPGQYQKRRIP